MKKNREIIKEKLTLIYGEKRSKKIIIEIEKLLKKYSKNISFQNKKKTFLDEKDIVLITYGDSITEANKKPLKTLYKFIDKYLTEQINIVHILPFYPYSSDDGFSVIDYKKVNPALGDWKDIEDIQQKIDLMLDLIVNHISSKSIWFKEYLKGNPEYDNYFISVDKDTDMSSVVRARAHPLLTKFKRKGEEIYLWTTFSSDQIDLNYANEKVLIEVIDVILFYASKKARIIRLDAIGHTWKKLGTSCINLKEIHDIIQLVRTFLNEIYPDVLLITETNVPHQENIGYFGNGYNEAQLIYQFALPLLVLHTFYTGDASRLLEWASKIQDISDQTTFFNVLATHDGLGVVPVTNILTDQEITDMVNDVREKGGYISYKIVKDGTEKPYEMNITYYSAIADPKNSDELNIKKFIASQAIILSQIGIPGIYIHSLFGTKNYLKGVEKTGQKRTINRKKLPYDKLKEDLANSNSREHKIFTEFMRLIHKRKSEKAFHPNGKQEVLFLKRELFSLLRTSPDGKERIIALHNITDNIQELCLIKNQYNLNKKQYYDIISEKIIDIEKISLTPYQIMWLKVFK
ncbi:sugar phosphorylase [Candidatus Atribacteria bacterium RBG_19FT_COMBO_35_14]|uniref:Sugar phosphorylase n=1 Tax=Candidatus Sediminicultor quintus TaxID=1797291 RepID=A0A1F5A4R5_9BACT|nr:MAG: sugar phosphorylase [Candidatus Atribacteria bacterium RBG_19FT_COMBO_35_14]